MRAIKFSCPHCDQHLQAAEPLAGRQFQCPGCNHLIHIPASPGNTASFDPKSGMTWDTFVPSGVSVRPKSTKSNPVIFHGVKPVEPESN